MGQIILANAVVRKQGYLYYVDGQGNVCEAKMKTGRTKKEEPERKSLFRCIVALKGHERN